jgi:hypothetical protein
MNDSGLIIYVKIRCVASNRDIPVLIRYEYMQAITPHAAGVAIDVPDNFAYPEKLNSGGTQLRTSSPGAENSGQLSVI